MLLDVGSKTSQLNLKFKLWTMWQSVRCVMLALPSAFIAEPAVGMHAGTEVLVGPG